VSHGSGPIAERAVADYLVAAGFTILGRNVRLGRLELDIVAQKDDLVVVVEVRTRGPGAFQGALESVAGEKAARLREATKRLWDTQLASRPDVKRVRIDVAAVTFEGGRTHVEVIEGAL
jgi:putative endonuclease